MAGGKGYDEFYKGRSPDNLKPNVCHLKYDENALTNLTTQWRPIQDA